MPDAPKEADRGKIQETDRMKILSAELQRRGSGSLRDFIAAGRAANQSWDEIALQLRTALKGSGYEPPRETVIKYAVRYGIISKRPTGYGGSKSRTAAA